jgi:hypothetical protein
VSVAAGGGSSSLPPGWERDGDTLYLHAGGARIERRVYREVEGWVLVPAELDRPVLAFPPDDAGRAAAFAAFAGRAAGPHPGVAPPRIPDSRAAACLEESDDDVRTEKEDEEDEDEDDPDPSEGDLK